MKSIKLKIRIENKYLHIIVYQSGLTLFHLEAVLWQLKLSNVRQYKNKGVVWGSLGGKGLPDLHTKFMMSGQGGHTTLKMQIIFTRKSGNSTFLVQLCPIFVVLLSSHLNMQNLVLVQKVNHKLTDLHNKNWVPFKPLWHYIDVPK